MKKYCIYCHITQKGLVKLAQMFTVELELEVTP